MLDKLKKMIPMTFSLLLYFPLPALAHILSITETQPFPENVPAFSRSVATFTVTNTSKTRVTAVNQTFFPRSSGLSVSNNTCGAILLPGQQCTLEVALEAASPNTRVSGEVKMWAKPTIDATLLRFQVNITQASLPSIELVPMSVASSLPAVRDPVVVSSQGEWLILSASQGDFHDFNNNFIDTLYVYNPVTQEIHSMSLDCTNLPEDIKNQLKSSDPNPLIDGDTLYMIGGFFTADNINFMTLNTLSSFNVPGIIQAIKSDDTNLLPFVAVQTTIPEFRVTGGQLGKIGDHFYLAFGQSCVGNYCATSQTYTNSLYKFQMDPTLSHIDILDSVTRSDASNSGWRRRDYSLAPIILNNTPQLFALAGPFTQGDNAAVWTNGISFDQNLISNDHVITQQANQYEAPLLSMYSAQAQKTYVTTFGSLSNTYWTSGGLFYDNTTPYGNILDMISIGSNDAAEYANLQPVCSGQPLASCLYMGIGTAFIHAGNFYDARKILQLDALPMDTPVLVGYLYGGLVSTGQEPFGTSPTEASNSVYAVYVTRKNQGVAEWQTITNLFN